MPLQRAATTLVLGLTLLLASASGARAQSPWTLTIRPNTTPLVTGECTPVRLDLLDATGREAPRNPAGARVSVADFDMSISGGALVGRYEGAAAWLACACPTSAGATATITATYPAKALADRSRVPGVSFQSSITVPVAAGRNSGVPIGCESAKTATVPIPPGTVPWAVILTSSVSALPIGACSPIRIDLRDATGKEAVRNAAGQLLGIGEFDMTVSQGGGGSAVGQWNGASIWLACVCQDSTVGAPLTITATYPAQTASDRVRVPGVAFQSSITLPLAAARGPANPAACSASSVRPAAPVGSPVSVAPRVPLPAPPAAVPGRTNPPVAVAPPLGAAPPVAVPVGPGAPAAGGRAPASPLVTQPGPAPTLTITGTPASATLAWQPVAGAASYIVTRQQAGVAPVEQTLPASNSGLYDSGLQPATAYTYTVRAIQPDGREGMASSPFTTPPAVNPAAFVGRQTDDEQVTLSWQPVAGAAYYVLFGPGVQGGKRVDLATTYDVSAVPPGPQEWRVASYYEPGPVSTLATAFSRAQVNVTAPLSGWVDLHAHPMVNLAFGGKLVHGGVDVGSLLPTDASCQRNVRAASMPQALGDDRPSHGGWNAIDFQCGDDFRQLLIGLFQEANEARTTGNAAHGFPDFVEWPKWDDITHQKMWWEWIERARDGGLRVMVALATNNKTLADAVAGPGDGPTDDKASADLQLTEIKAFVARHNDFMELARSAADVQRIVTSNRIAVVLGVEIDNIGNFNKLPLGTLPEAAVQVLIASEIQRLYDAGVRYIFPVHVMDNAFGGTAIYKNDFNRANLREAGHFWSVECAPAGTDITHKYTEGTEILRDAGAFVKLGLDPFRRSGPGPSCPLGHRNAVGLTPNGVFAVKEMMKRGMIVDIDHMSHRAAEATLDMAVAFNYPVVSGHTGIRGMPGADAENSRTRAQMGRISALHGMFGLGSDGVTAGQWSRNYQLAMQIMGYHNADPAKATYKSGAIAFGTDLNGLVRGPRPPGGARIQYTASFPMSTRPTGVGSWNYNTDGVAHYGMLWDFVADLRTQPSDGYTGAGGIPLSVAGGELVDAHLFRSASYFWRMWEQIERQKVAVH